jgi:predicted transcriptional regulator
MTLTVRLDTSLEAALNRYCTERGVTKSLVVQEPLAAYLLAGKPGTVQAGMSGAAGEVAESREPSATYKAFAEAGLLGGGLLGGISADKAAVRAVAMQRIRRSSR